MGQNNLRHLERFLWEGVNISDSLEDIEAKNHDLQQYIKLVNEYKEQTMINDFRGKYAFLSNFYMAPLTYEGISYTNSEAAFQSGKVTSHEERLEFANLKPSDAKRKGRRVNMRSDWNDIKYQVMYDVVKAKFQQNEDIKKKLLATEGGYLEEGNTWGDRIWGTVNGEGTNYLGKILMQVRKELLEEKEKL